MSTDGFDKLMSVLYQQSYWAALYCPRFAFFFQAEDGIRDVAVTGVQTCALPIWVDPAVLKVNGVTDLDFTIQQAEFIVREILHGPRFGPEVAAAAPQIDARQVYVRARSEEHTSELQSRLHLVCRLLLEKKKRPHC